MDRRVDDLVHGLGGIAEPVHRSLDLVDDHVHAQKLRVEGIDAHVDLVRQGRDSSVEILRESPR
jgi:hypothetical protein